LVEARRKEMQRAEGNQSAAEGNQNPVEGNPNGIGSRELRFFKHLERISRRADPVDP
jgi:hypothetical protein